MKIDPSRRIPTRSARLTRLRQQLATTSEADRASYRDEIAAWDPTSADALPPEDFAGWNGTDPRE